MKSLILNSRSAQISLAYLFFITLFVFAGPLFLQDPLHQNLEQQLQSPNSQFWFGTDELGRDILSRIALGGRLSLLVGIIATLISLFIGTTVGLISGYFGGKIDQICMRTIDILYSLPYMFLVIILISLLGRNLFVLFLALGAVQWLTTARIVRGQVLSLKKQEFIAAAIVLGSSHKTIMFKHLLPNVLPIVVVYATLTIPSIILQEAFLSFLGLNVQECTWGVLASEGAQLLDVAWWAILFPGMALTFTLLSLNQFGDIARDFLDPHS